MSTLNGEWLSYYSYQSGKATSSSSSEHIVIFEGNSENKIGRSVPQEDGSELTLQLRLNEEGCTLTGVWQEKTSPGGTYGGAVFYGAVQLILNGMNSVAEGKWVGFNSSRTDIKIGEWRIEKRQP